MAHFGFDITYELVFKTSRSGGKGGQHVNKTESKVEVSFDIAQSTIIDEDTRTILLRKLESKLHDGILSVYEQGSRSQVENKRIAIEKIYTLLEKAMTPVRPRKKTKPSKSSVQKRLDSKRKTKETKDSRKKFRF